MCFSECIDTIVNRTELKRPVRKRIGESSASVNQTGKAESGITGSRQNTLGYILVNSELKKKKLSTALDSPQCE